MRPPLTLSYDELVKWEGWVYLSSWASTCPPKEYQVMMEFINVLKRSDSDYGMVIMKLWNSLQGRLGMLSRYKGLR